MILRYSRVLQSHCVPEWWSRVLLSASGQSHARELYWTGFRAGCCADIKKMQDVYLLLQVG